jgi:hypothetical protein
LTGYSEARQLKQKYFWFFLKMFQCSQPERLE